ncbi:MAG: hypothetical protein CVV40_00270 [Planctomycetes bacterium HGW-Planctomycetes-2]|nr:MAG: hypothetical protein CVV40_00270 [Planctomycetes bacterium HGW-Planctomycetes-2]
MDIAGAPAGRLAIVIDRSASMSAQDGAEGPPPGGEGGGQGPRSRLEEARRQALEAVNQLASGTQAMVIVFAERPEIIAPLTSDHGLLRGAIGSINPSDASGNLDAALAVVGAALAPSSSDAGAAPARVLLLSDGAFDRPFLPTPRSAAALGATQVRFVRIGPEQAAPRDNFAIVALAARRDYEDPALIRLFLRAQSTSAEPQSRGLTCLLDAAPVASTILALPAATPNGPGEASHSFEILAHEGGLVTVTLTGGDRLASDNTAALVLDPPKPLRILLVQPNTPSSLIDFLLPDALAALQPGELRPLTLGEYESLAASNPGEIASASLIVFDRSTPSAIPPAPSISIGAALPISGLGVTPYADDDPDGAASTFAFWLRTHPVMRFVSLGGVSIARPLKLTLPTQTDQASSSAALASGPAGPLIALLETAGVRRLILAFELADSRWWQDASFPVFLKNAADYLTLSGDESAGLTHKPGAPISFIPATPPSPARSATTIRVTGPVSFERDFQPGDSGAITLGGLPLAGVYTISGAGPRDRAVAVSMLDPFESGIETRDQIIIAGDPIAAQTLGAVTPREVWRWFVLAALVLGALEWTLYARQMRL